MESQAFRFAIDEEVFVLRINISMRGFEKDRWACDAVAGQAPVPRVVQLGWLDADTAYCISEWVPGISLEESAPSIAQGLVAEVEEVWRRISVADVSSIGGFGDFDAAGLAPGRSWREVLQTTLEAATKDLPQASRSAGLPDPAYVLDTYGQLIDRCPEERALIHGDFGSNNILVHGTDITAVLDWENAMVGDPLYDVANTYLWATYLPCMELQAVHFDKALSSLPGYRDRVLCYSLKIGLDEARSNALQGDTQMATWSLGRCIDLQAQRRGLDKPI